MNSSESTPSNSTPRLSVAPFSVKPFDFSRVQGLSPHALEVHKSLYATYVKELNTLLPLVYAPQSTNELSATERLQNDGLVRRFAFERDGVILHELFFEALQGSSPPPRAGGTFMEAVNASFGGFDGWKRDVLRFAQTRGIGWVLTLHSRGDNRLTNVWVDDHTRGLLADSMPIVVFDLWEHAYLFDFKPSERLKYMQILFDNTNWDVIETRCH